MAKEIERKFLIVSEEWKKLAQPILLRQGYLVGNEKLVVRIRTIEDKAFLTIKSGLKNITRDEYEYAIPFEDAQEMLERLCQGTSIVKNRYHIEYQGQHWEIDEFLEQNEGLIIAEIELEGEEQSFSKPPWIGREVSHDPRYFNAYLAQHPFQSWSQN